MNVPIIEIENLSKLYRLDAIGYGSLRASIARRWRRWLGKPVVREYPTGIAPEQAGPISNTFWALRNLTASVEEGEILGIIGRNGAGKSTLLKVLSRITEPTEGRAVIRGSVGSLLEVGAGFHGDLSGRDNIFLHGSILGMKKVDIARQFDSIVAFAGIEAFVDTPVKHYSTGMYVRLAFAVAAHLEPDVLIVDEVLAVGDAAFQKKCLGRMKDVSTDHGRTLLFVSHDLEAVQRLCSRCLLLEKGRIVASGDTRTVVAQYLAGGAASAHPNAWIDVTGAAREGTGQVRFSQVRLSSHSSHSGGRPYADGPLDVTVAVDASELTQIQSIAVTFCDESGRKLLSADTGWFGRTTTLPPGRTTIHLRIASLHLKPGTYGLALWMARYAGSNIGHGDVVDYVEKAMDVDVVDVPDRSVRTSLGDTGPVTCEFEILDISHEQASRPAVIAAS